MADRLLLVRGIAELVFRRRAPEDIGDPNVASIDPNTLKGSVKYTSSLPDEWPSSSSFVFF